MLSRRLRREPGFAAVAVLTLALGIGANVAVFSIVYGALLRPLRFPQPSRLVCIEQQLPQFVQQFPKVPVAQAEFLAWQHARSLSSQALVSPSTYDLTGAGSPRQVTVDDVSANLFRVLGVAPWLGRDFAANEDQPGRNHVVILTNAFWRSQFGADPHVLDRSLDLDGVPSQIVGVLPPDFTFPGGQRLLDVHSGITSARAQLFRPVAMAANPLLPSNFELDYAVIARLRPGVSAAQARAELDGLTTNLLTSAHIPMQASILVTALRQQIAGNQQRGLWLLLAAVGAILLVVCFNLAGLFLVRMQAHQHETAVRVALGVSRARLMREVLAEGGALALFGGLLGAVAAWAAVRALVHAAPAAATLAIPRLSEVSVSVAALAFALILAAFCALAVSFYPAWRAADADPQAALRSADRGTAGPGLRLRAWLTAAQAALTMLLLVTAGLLSASYLRLMNVNPGFQASGRLTAQVEWNASQRLQRSAFFLAAADQLRALPGVTAAGLINTLPTQGSGDTETLSFLHDNRPEVERPTASRLAVSPGYFAAAGIPLLRGHLFTGAEMARAGQNPNLLPVLISAAAARRVWPARDPLGRRFIWNQYERQVMQVVGVVGDVRASLATPPANFVYEPVTGYTPVTVSFVLRTSAPPAALAAAVRQTIWNLQPSATIPQIESFDDVVTASVAARRFQLWLVLAFAFCALLLAALGIYGVAAFAATRRLPEFGLRLALGARPASLFGLILRQGLAPVACGLLAGLAAGLAAARLLTSLLFGVSPANPLVLAAAAALLLLAAALACALPALRAMRADPLSVLRAQ